MQNNLKIFFSLILVMLLALISSATFAQEDSLKFNPDGFNKFYYKNGKLASEGTMRNGKPDGYWKNYHKKGGLKSEGNRKDFLLDSTWKFYDEKGKLTLEINYKEGKKNGYRYTYQDRKSTRLNSSHTDISRMPSSA